ncbi:hypothetical protein PV326_013991, partial [Microctonus aethiopoides]
MERANNCLLRGAKLCARISGEVAKALLWSKLSSRRHSGYYCGAGHSRRRLVSIVVWITPYATPWLILSILYCGSQESGVRDSSTSPSNGPVEEARERRGLRQTSWETQWPVDHADPTDRTIFA